MIERAGLILVAQRPAHKHLALKWEFPGGKVEPGETPAAAIVREIQEELGGAFVITRALPPFTHAYAETIELIPFVGHLAPGSPEPVAHEHVALRWATPADLPTFDLAPADLPILAQL